MIVSDTFICDYCGEPIENGSYHVDGCDMCENCFAQLAIAEEYNNAERYQAESEIEIEAFSVKDVDK